MAHRIRGLLTGIEGYTDLLLESVEQSDQRELAFRILESTSRIEGILADLQHYNDPLEAHFHRVPAAAIAPDTMGALSDREFDRVSITNSLGSETVLRADESLLRQALLALIRNALEADGAQATAVSLTTERDMDGDCVLFRVRNFGSHLSHDASEPVFQAFYTTKSANLGLGLTLARRIARIHRGDLVISSRAEDAFTEFTLSIPILKDSASAQ